jgi:hypothetical protein
MSNSPKRARSHDFKSLCHILSVWVSEIGRHCRNYKTVFKKTEAIRKGNCSVDLLYNLCQNDLHLLSNRILRHLKIYRIKTEKWIKHVFKLMRA